MGRIKLFTVILLPFLVFISCSQSILDNTKSTKSEIEINEDSISKKFYTKNLTKNFTSFLENPTAISGRTAADGLSEECLFAEIWNDLTEEEQNMLLENAANLEVSKDSLLSIKNDSPASRAALNGDTTEIDSIAAIYSYNEWLNDYFGSYMTTLTIKDEESKISHETMPANLAIEYLSKLEKWNEIENILLNLNSELTANDVKIKYNEMISYLELPQNTNISSRASITIGYQQEPIRERVGESLSDGTILLTCFKKKAFPIIGGDWAHAGIFSKDAFKKNGRTDSGHCVYTAQPNGYDNFPDFMKPDRQNHCCLDTICMYSYQKKMATMIPKNYSEAKAGEAVKYAKEAFYDHEDEEYHIPIFEFFGVGDTSHDMTVKNPYCSKVVYSAWNKAGINLDSNKTCGNIISPDDIYGSAYNRYFTITLKILWWSKSWTVQTYNATSVILTNERQ